MKNRKIIDKIGFITILLTIVLLNVCIGSNIMNPIWIIQILVSVITLLFIIIKKIQKGKNIILKGKIDIAVLIFMISTAIPYIARTYASLEGTINFILKYWTIYSFYILVRNTIKETKDIIIVIKTLIMH